MIQIQIATSLLEDRVGDVRWVLLDPSEVGEAPAAKAEVTPARPSISASAPTPTPTPRRGPRPGTPASASPSPTPVQTLARNRPVNLTYQALRIVVLAASLAAAWWMASNALDKRVATNKTGPVLVSRTP